MSPTCPQEVPVEPPREGSLADPPREAEIGNNETPPEYLGAPMVDPLPEGVETNDAEESPGPPDLILHSETVPEPVTTKSPTDSSDPTPEEAGTGKRVEPPQQPQAVSGIVEVRQRRIE